MERIKEVVVPEKMIQEVMRELDVCREDAHEICVMELRDKQNRRYEQSDKKITQRKPREPKIDEGKKEIVEIICEALTKAGYSAKITNVSKTVEFEDITVNVIRHRKK